MKAATFLAFDFGTQKIGIAIGDTITRSARSLATIPNDWKRVEAVVAEWRPQACVVGLPLAEDGGDQPITRQARAFARQLHAVSKRPVHLCDERYSSRSAAQALRSGRADGTLKRRLKRGDEDSAAARLILEQWLAEGHDQAVGEEQA